MKRDKRVKNNGNGIGSWDSHKNPCRSEVDGDDLQRNRCKRQDSTRIECNCWTRGKRKTCCLQNYAPSTEIHGIHREPWQTLEIFMKLQGSKEMVPISDLLVCPLYIRYTKKGDKQVITKKHNKYHQSPKNSTATP